MESSEIRTSRSLVASVTLFGAGALVGAGATWLIMSAAAAAAGSDDHHVGDVVPPPSCTSTPPTTDCPAQLHTPRQWCSDQLRSILADVEMRLMEAVDELVSHFTTRTSDHSDQTSNSCQHPSPSATHGDATQTQTAQPDAVAVTQRQRATNDDTHRNTNNSSASVVRRLFSQVDRLFEGCSEDRERALELLRVREQQLSHDVNFVWRLAKATHFKSKMEAERDKNEEKRLAYLSRDLAARSLDIDPHSAAAHKWFAITTGVIGDYESPKVRIQTGFTFKEHVEKAIALNPKDPTNYYLLGRWWYGVYALSWVERKLASAFYTTLPTATVDDALKYFVKAEGMNPGMFKENLLFIGKCYIEKKDFTTAVRWLQQAAKVPIHGVEDESCQKEVNSLLAKYQRHAEVTMQ